MESRAKILTFLTLALWTTAVSGQSVFCAGQPDGSICGNCGQPVDCTNGTDFLYTACDEGKACVVASGASYCVSHDQTPCACSGVGDQCDPYNDMYVEHCGPSGPILVTACDNSTCSNGECSSVPTEPCVPDSWNIDKPECTTVFYCDAGGNHLGETPCPDGQFVNAELECTPAPFPACDGSCSGRCPHPTDCGKFFVCEGSVVMSSEVCPEGSQFDAELNKCASEATCVVTAGCNIEVETGASPATVTSDGSSTPPSGGSSTTTPSGGLSTTISSGGSSTTTPSGGSSSTTPSGGSSTTTPSGGSSTTTPSGGSSTTTPSGGSSTTTPSGGSSTFSPPPDSTCTESTVGDKSPVQLCSQYYYLCHENANGSYGNTQVKCIGDLYFNPDPAAPYCVPKDQITECQS